MGVTLADAALGIGTYAAQGAGDLIFGQFRQNQQLKGQRKALEQQNKASYDLWQKTNYPAQVEQLNKAGLNPGLLYGMGGSGGATLGNSNAMPDSAPNGMGILQGALLKAQIENINADTKKKLTDAGYTAGAATDVANTSIEKMKAETNNVKAQEAFTNVQTAIAKLDEVYKGETLTARVASADVELQKALNALTIIENEADISTATKKDAISLVRLEVLTKILGLEATKQGISESKSRQALMSEQGKKMLADIEQGWNGLIEAGKGRNAEEQRNNLNQQMFEFEKFTGIPTELLKTVLGAGILKGIFGPNRTEVKGFR